jgi:hypothetical protein
MNRTAEAVMRSAWCSSRSSRATWPTTRLRKAESPMRRRSSSGSARWPCGARSWQDSRGSRGHASARATDPRPYGAGHRRTDRAGPRPRLQRRRSTKQSMSYCPTPNCLLEAREQVERKRMAQLHAGGGGRVVSADRSTLRHRQAFPVCVQGLSGQRGQGERGGACAAPLRQSGSLCRVPQ